MRRFQDTPSRGQSYVHRPSVYAVLPRGDHFLLTHQAAPEPEFQLPGGGVDPGESPLAALHREVLEETGWRIGSPRRLTAYRRFTYMPEYDLWAEKICQIYLARPVRRLGPPRETGHTEVWVDRDAAVNLLASRADRQLMKWLVD